MGHGARFRRESRGTFRRRSRGARRVRSSSGARWSSARLRLRQVACASHTSAGVQPCHPHVWRQAVPNPLTRLQARTTYHDLGPPAASAPGGESRIGAQFGRLRQLLLRRAFATPRLRVPANITLRRARVRPDRCQMLATRTIWLDACGKCQPGVHLASNELGLPRRRAQVRRVARPGRPPLPRPDRQPVPRPRRAPRRHSPPLARWHLLPRGWR